MNRKKSLATDSIILTFVQCITLVTSMVQTMLLSRVLTKTEYGTYSQGILVINFVTPFLLLGLSNAINFFYNQGKEKRVIRKYIDTIFSIVVIIGGIAGGIIIIFRKWICVYFNNPELYPLIVLIAFRPLLKNIVSLYQPLYISNNMAKVIAVRNLVIGLTQVGIIVGALIFSKNLVLIFGLLLVLDFAQVVIFKQIYEKNSFKIEFLKLNKEIVPEIFKYAFPLALSTMVGTLSTNMDKMLIGRMLSTEEFAIYSNMAKELPFSFVVSSLTTVVTPILIQFKNSNRFEDMKRLWSRYIEAGFIITWILVAGALICGKELLIFLYSEKYVEGYWVFIIYLLVISIRFTYFGMVLTIYGKTKEILYFSCTTLVSNLILNYIFINCLGMIGPAIATLLSVMVMNGGQMAYSFRLLNARVDEIFDLKKTGIFIFELFLVGIVVYNAKEKIFITIENNVAILFSTYALFVMIMCIFQFKNLKKIYSEMNNGFEEKSDEAKEGKERYESKI